jgi:UPF0271 protein
MLLNCDLGESYGHWAMGHDVAVMPYIDQASIACGFHAGDPLTICNTLALAAEHGVAIGAHPAYPDVVGFGRRHMALSRDEIIAALHYQIAALDGMAQIQGLTLSYVKPHGALYHDMMSRDDVRSAIFQAIGSYHRPLALVMQSTANQEAHSAQADTANVQVLFEAFADRCYANDGSLLHRSQPNAIHNRERMLAQVQQLQQDSTVTAADGTVIPLKVDTLCVHGDNAEGVQAIEAIRSLVGHG